jgi:hypothetical protein
MAAIKDVINAIGAALEGLAQARNSAAQARIAAASAHDMAKAVGLVPWIEGTGQVKDALDAEVANLVVMVANLERARQTAQAMADST